MGEGLKWTIVTLRGHAKASGRDNVQRNVRVAPCASSPLTGPVVEIRGGAQMEQSWRFLTAFLAVLWVQLFEPHAAQIPYWQVLAAAVAGTALVWGIEASGKWMRARRGQ